jgi:hypothetical protein
MNPAIVFLAIGLLMFVAGKWCGEKVKELLRVEASPALAIAISSGKSLVLFVCVFAFLYAIKAEFDDPLLFTPERFQFLSR